MEHENRHAGAWAEIDREDAALGDVNPRPARLPLLWSHVQPLPLQVFWHVRPAHDCVHLPPLQLKLQIAPLVHVCLQPPPEHEATHVALAAHACTQLPAGHSQLQLAPAAQL